MPGLTKAALLTTMTLSIAACATGRVDDRRDPFEGFNRQMYDFNTGLDEAVLEPVARGYRHITTEPVRQGVSNFVDNLGEPATFTNEILQGSVPRALGTGGRFLINSTIGIVGVLDPATPIGIARSDEDFGQTLGVWGMAAGPYLMLPILGATNPRDLFGDIVDIAANPLNLINFDGDRASRVVAVAMEGVSDREAALEVVEDLRASQLDPYTTVRRAYVKGRAARIGNLEMEPTDIQSVSQPELEF